MMAELPSTIQVGPYHFSVTDEEHAFDKVCAENEGLVWGYIRYGKCEIILAPQQAHAVWHLADTKHEDEEEHIRILATGLLDTLKRNPELVKYLIAED